MIDLHCHLLPDVDDGSASLPESVDMIHQYLRAGYTGAVCTSHFHPDRYLVGATQIEEGVALLQEECQRQGLSFYLYCGHEIFATAQTPKQIQSGEALPLAGSRYVLLELPFDVAPASLSNMLFQLQLNGYIPIIGHLERYRYVQEHEGWADPLIQKGALIQLNLWSLSGDFGSASYKVAHRLMETNRVHFLSTDAHGTTGRSADVGQILDSLRKTYGTERIDQLTKTNPSKVVENRGIDPGFDQIIREAKPKKGFFRRLFS